MYQNNNENVHYVVGTPKWYIERFQVKVVAQIVVELEFNYPYAKDLEFPAYEYYWNGTAWMHPKYEHPARYYHQVNGKWVYDTEWDWNEIVVSTQPYENVYDM